MGIRQKIKNWKKSRKQKKEMAALKEYIDGLTPTQALFKLQYNPHGKGKAESLSEEDRKKFDGVEEKLWEKIKAGERYDDRKQRWVRGKNSFPKGLF